MRFAITATDRYIGVFHALLERSWTPLKVFTTVVDQRIHHHKSVIELAQRLKLEIQLSRMTEQNLRALGEAGCEVLVVASYGWRIGNWRPHLRYAVNFHPSPLPEGRGPYPVPGAILGRLSRWGVACHKLEPEFDTGDVLRKIEFPISAAEDHESLDLKVQLAARRLADDIAVNFVEAWNTATPQVGGSYYPMWKAEDRQLDFSQPVEDLLRRIRAFGLMECSALLNSTRFFVRRAVGWQEPHRFTPGSVVHFNGRALVVAAADGFIGLTEWSLIDPDVVTGTVRR